MENFAFVAKVVTDEVVKILYSVSKLDTLFWIIISTNYKTSVCTKQKYLIRQLRTTTHGFYSTRKLNLRNNSSNSKMIFIKKSTIFISEVL